MGFSWLNDFTAKAKTKLAQFNNGPFKDATMAVCALVSAADGQIEAEEKKKVASLIQNNELLSVFDPVQLRDTFLSYADKAVDDFTRLDLINAVRRLKGNDEQADTAMRIGLIIANADGDFEDSEKKIVRELCTVLSLNPANYGA